jgi:hypothetical protein
MLSAVDLSLIVVIVFSIIFIFGFEPTKMADYENCSSG